MVRPRLVSVNVGLPRDVEVRGKTVRTSIFKAPVAGTVRVRETNLEGDWPADLAVHGGIRKAVYVYPSEHYAFWRGEFPGMDLPWGFFGENLTTEGVLEDTTCIGDRLRIGSAEFVVTQPRTPCVKLAIRFGREDIITRFLANGRSGFYLSVAREGHVTAGDPIACVERSGDGVSVAEVAGRHSSS